VPPPAPAKRASSSAYREWSGEVKNYNRYNGIQVWAETTMNKTRV
jgi:hypothetical protein